MMPCTTLNMQQGALHCLQVLGFQKYNMVSGMLTKARPCQKEQSDEETNLTKILKIGRAGSTSLHTLDLSEA